MCGASAAENSARNARKITSVAENILCDISNDAEDLAKCYNVSRSSIDKIMIV